MFKILICLDQSGSMQAMASEVVSGLHSFLEEQKTTTTVKGNDPMVSLYTFDNVVHISYENKRLSEIPPLNYNPNGFTALYDAIKQGIERNQSERDVVMVVITDGEDNSSQISSSDVQKMLRKQEQENNWKVIYLGKSDIFEKQKGMFEKSAGLSPFTRESFVTVMNNLGRQVSTYRSESQKGTDTQNHKFF